MKRVIKFLFWITASLLGLLLVGFFVFLGTSSAAQDPIKGKYSSEIYQCINAAKEAKARTIQDFVCPEGVSMTQDLAYQVVLDLEFQKIDKEIKKELEGLQNEKTKDVIVMNEKIKNWFDMTSSDPKYLKQYLQVCSDLEDEKSVLKQVVSSFSGGVTTDGDTSKFVQGDGRCSGLAQTKVDAYRDIALLIATMNVAGSYQEDKEKFTTKLKEQYENFLNAWMVYIGELARIKSKWTSKIKIQNG